MSSTERNYKVTMDKSDFDSKAKGLLSFFKKIDADGKKLSSMDTSGSVKGLRNIHEAARNVKFDNITNGFDTMQASASRSTQLINGFIMGVGIQLSNLAGQAVQTGLKIGDALTFKGARDGFHEYELNMDSIQTILANAPGETTKSVNAALDELNKYADDTVYKFSDMTYAIGRFTAAGNDMQTSIKAIKGLSNYAASVGASPEIMKNAYTQISQALSAGKFQAVDWMSVQNANLESAGLKKKLVENAIRRGDLQESDRDEVLSNFRGSLGDKNTRGWLKADNFLSAMQEFAEDPAMLDAATKVRTFSKLIDTLQESIGSTWTSTWRIILGDFDQATELFTNISNAVGGFISKMNEGRNVLLDGWLNKLGGRKDMLEGFANVLKYIGQVAGVVSKVFREFFPKKTAEDLKSFSTSFLKWSEGLHLSLRNITRLQDALRGFFRVVQTVQNGVKLIAKAFLDMIPFKGIGNILLAVGGAIGKFITAIATGFNKIHGQASKAENSISIFKRIGTLLNNILTWLAGKLTEFVYKYAWFFERIGELAATGWIKFKEWFDKVIDWAKGFFEFLKPYFGKVGEFLKPLMDSLGQMLNTNLTAENFDNLLNTIGKAISDFWGWISGLGNGAWDQITWIAGVFGKMFQGFGKATGEVNVLERLGEALKKGAQKLGEGFKAIENGMNSTTIGRAFNLAVAALISAWAFKMYKSAKKINATIEEISLISQAIRKPFTDLGNAFKEVGKAMAFNLKGAAFVQFAIGIGVLSGALWVLSTIPADRALVAATIMVGVFLAFSKMLKTMDGTLKDVSGKQILQLSAFVLTFGWTMRNIGKTMSELGALEDGQLLKATGSVLVIIMALGAVVTATKLFDVEGGIRGSVGLGIAVNLLMIPIKILGEMDTSKLEQGVTTVRNLILTIGLLLVAIQLPAKLGGSLKHAAASFLMLGVAVSLMVIPIGLLGRMPEAVLKQGATTTVLLMVAFAGLTAIINHVSKSGMSWSSVAMLGMLAVAVNMMVLPVALLSALDASKVWGATKTLIILMATLTGAMVVIANLPDPSASMLKLLGVTAIMTLISIPLGLLSLLNPQNVLASALALGGVMLALSVAMRIIAGMPITGIAKLKGVILMAGSIAVLSLALATLANIPADGLIRAGVAIAAVMAGVLVVAGVVGAIPQVAAGLTVLAGAISVVVAAVGGGAFLFGAGVALIVGSVALLLNAIKGLIQIFPQMGQSVADGINSLADQTPRIAEGLGRLFDNLGNAAPTLAAKLATFLGKVFIAAITALPSFFIGAFSGLGQWLASAFESQGPTIKLGAENMLKGVISAFGSMIAGIMRLINEGLIGFLKRVLGGLPIVGDMLKGTMEAIENGAKSVEQGFTSMANNIVGGFHAAFHNNSPASVVAEDLKLINDMPMNTIGATKMAELMAGFAPEKHKGTIQRQVALMFDGIAKKGGTYQEGMNAAYEFVRGLKESGTLTEEEAIRMMTLFSAQMKKQDLKGLGQEKGKELGQGVVDGLKLPENLAGMDVKQLIQDKMNTGAPINADVMINQLKEQFAAQGQELPQEYIDQITKSFPNADTSGLATQATELGAQTTQAAADGADGNAVANKIAEGLSWGADGVQAAVSNAFTAGQGVSVNWSTGVLSNDPNTWFTEAATTFSAQSNAMAAEASTKGDATSGNFEGAAAGRIGGIKGVFDKIKSNTESTLNSIDAKSPGDKAGSSFVSAVGSYISEARGAGNRVGGGAKSALESSSEGSHGVGSYFGQGFVSGVSSWASAAANAAAAIGNAAMSALRWVGIVRSPSRAMKKIGSYYGEGAVIGLASWIDEAKNTGEQFGQAILDAVDMAQGLDEQPVYEPKIRPVMDLSNVDKWSPQNYNALLSVDPVTGGPKAQNGGNSISNVVNVTVNGNANETTVREIAFEVDRILKNHAESQQMSKGLYRGW